MPEKAYSSDWINRLFTEGIKGAQATMNRYIDEHAPKGYPPLTEPAPKPTTETMTPEDFLALSPEQQRYRLRRMVEGGS